MPETDPIDDGFLFRALLRETPDSVYVKDRQARLLRVSQSMVRNLGVAGPDELIGRSDVDLFGMDFGHRTYIEDLRVMETNEAISGLIESRQLADGAMNWTLTTKLPIQDEAGEVVGLLGITREINELKQAEMTLQHLATHDSLTSLPNRYLLMDRLNQAVARALRDGASFGVLFIDIDDFKGINDSAGHETGDRVLRSIAEQLRASVRASDTIARLGGDEFVVVLEHADREEAPVHRRPDPDRGQRPPCQAGRRPHGHGQHRDQPLPRARRRRPWICSTAADYAMYLAKKHGKDRAAMCPSDDPGGPSMPVPLDSSSPVREPASTGRLLPFRSMSRTRTSSATELLVDLRRDDPTPLHAQLEREIRTAIRSGRLAAGSALPSTRALADQLELSRGVVVEAYEQLVAEGYLTSQPGGATRVGARAAVEPARADPDSTGPTAPEIRVNFGYGRPDVTEFPRQLWLRSIRRVLNEVPSDRLNYLDKRGATELREALASYLNRVRGTVADPNRIVICNGFAQAQGLVTMALKQRGARRIAVEDPGQNDTLSHLETVPVPVDEEGIVVDALEATDADVVLLTPAHQFPTGAVLSAERRSALVAWATSRNRLILEDDYDAEYRYDREPIGSLHGLAPDRVIYAGTASKTLAPGLRLGWLLLPANLVELVADIKDQSDRGSPSLEQLAFADFLGRGEFDHHLRRMRPIYRARRDALLRALQRHLPDLRPVGASAGLHVVAWLPPGVDEASVVERALALGVNVAGITPYRRLRGIGPGGLLFGYGTPSEAEIEEGIRLVAEALAATRRAAVPGDPTADATGAATA